MAKYYPDYFSISNLGFSERVFPLFSTVGDTVEKVEKSVPLVCRSLKKTGYSGSIKDTYGYKVKNQCPTVNTFHNSSSPVGVWRGRIAA